MNDLPPWERDAYLLDLIRQGTVICRGVTPSLEWVKETQFQSRPSPSPTEVIDQMELQMMGIRP